MASKYELSKTYQYRKVMKPLLERKRRARINKCLDDLKDLMAECLQQQSGDPNAKLEKVDILELTVQHLRKLKCQRNAVGAAASQGGADKSSFRSGYIQAANEVSRCLAAQPNVDVQLGTTLMTHLGVRLNQLEAVQQHNTTITTTAINAPLSINCYSTPPPTARAQTQRTSVHAAQSLYSPVSSGYASDSESAYATSASSSPMSSSSRSQQNSHSPAAAACHTIQSTAGLLQVATAAVWRPW